ncbi:MAG TPA: type II toxin-antitoxin system RelE/ParE family toxin [Saprospiraceae bacterium]|nr:type II toxin-antitoxin system RelE/ParE family toxin [Saprospiraceae bacterium]
MNVVISDKAYSDLTFLFQYSIETFGLPKTEAYLKSIYEKISYLAVMPGIGHTHKSLPDYLRVINVAKHLVIYTAKEPDVVIVLRIVHHKMNLSDIT